VEARRCALGRGASCTDERYHYERRAAHIGRVEAARGLVGGHGGVARGGPVDRIHTNRCSRTYTDAEGAWNLAVRGTAEQGARFEAALEPVIDEMFARARAEGRRESREAYAYDALMALVERDPASSEKRARKARYLALLRVDFEVLARGETEAGEVCEIAGIGPVPVAVARDLLGDSILKLVITRGVDVAGVVHLGRGATAAATTKHTRLEELDPLCPHHHKLKTTKNWSLVHGTGRRAFVPPDDRRHPRNRPPP
jgi:hypothetical protein